MIERAATKRQGSVTRGIRSKVFNAFGATDQFKSWGEDVEDHYSDRKIEGRFVKLPNWSNDKDEQNRISEELSGEVKVFHISELGVKG